MSHSAKFAPDDTSNDNQFTYQEVKTRVTSAMDSVLIQPENAPPIEMIDLYSKEGGSNLRAMVDKLANALIPHDPRIDMSGEIDRAKEVVRDTLATMDIPPTAADMLADRMVAAANGKLREVGLKGKIATVGAV